MKYGLNVPNFGAFGDIKQLVEYAKAAEAAGWDGFYLWDHLRTIDLPATDPFVDPWIAMTAIAANTTNLRFGALVTPFSRRRPGKVARETVSLDRLSDGRLVVGAGIGGDYYRELSGFGEEVGDKVNAAKLDEALYLINELWTGKEVTHKGDHYTLEKIQFHPTPVQEPRIPVWLAGVWPGTKPFQRAARWDGIVPLDRHNQEHPDGFPPEEVRKMMEYIHKYRESDAPFDVVITTRRHELGKGYVPATDEYFTYLAEMESAGLTWALESLDMKADHQQIVDVINAGPARLS